MNFKKLQENIKDFIENKFPDAVESADLSPIDNFIADFIDLDKYKNSNLVFIDFVNYHFDNLTLDTQDMEFTFKFYIVLRGNTALNLKDALLDYVGCFYNFFYSESCNRSFDGLIDIGLITDVDIYNAALGNVNIKVAEFTVNCKLEDITND